MIEKLENAGLGYHVREDQTPDKIGGKMPLRRLVYRVKEIPASMFPLIWDFGTLSDDAETKYIRQMVVKTGLQEPDLLVRVLHASQNYMRQRSDECK